MTVFSLAENVIFNGTVKIRLVHIFISFQSMLVINDMLLDILDLQVQSIL